MKMHHKNCNSLNHKKVIFPHLSAPLTGCHCKYRFPFSSTALRLVGGPGSAKDIGF